MYLLNEFLSESNMLSIRNFVLKNANISNISFDSRKCTKDSLYIAILGQNNDGHDFVKDAKDKGARVFFVQDEYLDTIEFNYHVDSVFTFKNTQKSLLKIFSNIIHNLNIFNIAITGSNGKTTTKNLLGYVLSKYKKTFYTKGNFNSVLGLPLALNELEKGVEYGVWEFGISEIGEMDRLQDSIKPQISVITNISSAHIGNFGSRDVIAKEKLKIADNSNYLFCLENNEYFEYFSKNTKAKIITCKDIPYKNLGLQGQIVYYKDAEIKTNLIGDYNRMNLILVLNILDFLNVPMDIIKENIQGFVPKDFRSEIKIKDNITYILDCYNSNPQSLKAALLNFENIKQKGRKIAILGDMKELGKYSVFEHEQMIKYIKFLDFVFLVGDEVKNIKSDFCKYYNNVFDLKKDIKNQLKEGDLVLVKGSRAMSLEKILE